MTFFHRYLHVTWYILNIDSLSLLDYQLVEARDFDRLIH